MLNFLNACGMMGLDRFGSRFSPNDRFGQMRLMHPGFLLVGLLITAAVIVGIVFLVRALIRHSGKSYGTDAVAGAPQANSPKMPASTDSSLALQILDERLARGEIDTDEYRRRKDELLRP